jgi:hypothetical protein
MRNARGQPALGTKVAIEFRPGRCLVAVHVHVDGRHDVVGRIDGMVTPRLVDDGLAIRQVLPVRVRHGVHPSRNPTLRWPL